MTWRPAKTIGLIAGLLIGLMLITMLTIIIESFGQQSPDLGAILSAIIMGLVALGLLRWAMHFISLIRLSYRLDRNSMMIRYGPAQHIVPLQEITDIVPGHQLALPDAKVTSVWPGYLSKQVLWDPTRPLWIHGTTHLSRHIVLITERAMYAISPANPERFIEDLRRRRALGAVREVEHTTLAVGIASWSIWRDQPYWLTMLLALLLNVSLFAISATGFANLPAGAGQLGLGALYLPSIGGMVLLFNALCGALLYHKERLATWLLLAVTLAVQLLLALVALRVLW